jgi:hypothetical protein
MLMTQYNCRKAYAIIIAAIETGIQLNTAFICFQEPYIDINSFFHPGYDLRWPEKGKKEEKKVLIAIKRDILNRVATEVRSNLVNHPYFLTIDIWELHLQIRAKMRRTRLINSYDNRIGLGTVY